MSDPPSAGGPTGAVGRSLAWLIGLGALLLLPGLGARDLWNPNEPLYGQAVREMAASGAWLLPTIGGQPFAEKPILLFWMGRAASLVGGRVDEWSLRLPIALCVLLIGVPAVHALTRRFVDRVRAALTVVLFLTIYMTWWGARTLQMDVLVMVSTLVAVAAGTQAIASERLRPRAWAAVGAAVGLGLLAKGPVAALLPGGILVVDAALAGRLRRLVDLRGPALAAAIAAALAAPWYIALAATGHGSELTEMLWRQNVTRLLDPWDHQAPWWYYLKYVWIDMAPWAWFAPLAAALPGREAGERRLDRLAWVWIAVVVVFFSLSPSKRSAYILPIAPAVAVLAAAVVDRLARGALPAWRRAAVLALLGWIGGTLLAVAPLLLLRAAPRYLDLRQEICGAAVWAGGCGAALLLALASPRRGRAAPAVLVVFLVGTYVAAGAVLLPRVDRYTSARGFMERVEAVMPATARLDSYRLWEWRAEYRFYGSRPIRAIGSADDLRRAWNDAEPDWIIVEGDRVEELGDAVGGAPEPAVEASIGSRRAYLFADPAAREAGSARPESPAQGVRPPQHEQRQGGDDQQHPVLAVARHAFGRPAG